MPPCCEDKSISIKVDDAQQVQPVIQLSHPTAIVEVIIPLDAIDDDLPSFEILYAPEKVPPPDRPFYVRNHAFLFYG